MEMSLCSKFIDMRVQRRELKVTTRLGFRGKEKKWRLRELEDNPILGFRLMKMKKFSELLQK